MVKKKALFYILAEREAERLGIHISEKNIRAMSKDFRASFGLIKQDEMGRFLKEEGIEVKSFTQIMRDFVCVKKLENLFADAIEERAEAYIRVSSVRNRLKQ